MPSGWRQEESQEDKNKERVIEIKPEVIQAAMKPELDSIKGSMTAMNEFIAEQRKEKKDREDAAAAAEARKAAQNREENKPDFILDPEGAMNHAMRPLAEANQVLMAKMQRDDLLGKLDYYSSDPEFKAKVDELIESQPLQNRSNTGVIMAAYKNTHYDMRKEIEEGKVKSLASINSNNGRGRASDEPINKDGKVTLSDEEKMYAKKLGVTEDQWAKQKGTLEYV